MGIPTDEIRTDLGTQTRAEINEEAVQEYADRLEAGEEAPPVLLYHDGSQYILADGFHRVMAANRVGKTEVPAAVEQGTKQDAVAASLRANQSHGVRRTNRDKQIAVKVALREFDDWSDRSLAEMVGVSHDMVNRMRGVSSNDSRKTKGKDGIERPAKQQKKAKGGEPSGGGNGEPEFELSRELEALDEVLVDRARPFEENGQLGQFVSKVEEVAERMRGQG